mmetsp:Transcript_33918/g.24960  ORF Transcript_33918/g.24960 Transcript_33918/m.24960 type:complete len:96 (+) Transcript_33918:457-744(+)
MEEEDEDSLLLKNNSAIENYKQYMLSVGRELPKPKVVAAPKLFEEAKVEPAKKKGRPAKKPLLQEEEEDGSKSGEEEEMIKKKKLEIIQGIREEL